MVRHEDPGVWREMMGKKEVSRADLLKKPQKDISGVATF